jgi:hypothetical protein
MRRGRSTGAPTRAVQERFLAIKEIGCVVARLRGFGFVPCEIHHTTIGGKHGQKRRGHEFTVGLNPWSHRGMWLVVASDPHVARKAFGPSYAEEPRAFRELYPDDVLLAEQDRLIELWKKGELP